MPIKLSPSHKQVDRNTKKVTVVHDYIKCKSKSDLIEKFNDTSTKPKVRQKIKNELVRRGGVVFK